MAPLIVDGVARFTVHQRMAARPIANIYDVHLYSTAIGDDRQEMCFRFAGRLLNTWHDTIRVKQTSSLTCEKVSWVDLDSLSGSTGERNETSETTWPAAGGNTAGASAGNTSVLITKSSGGNRGTRPGRMYVAGVIEGDTDSANPNILSSAAVASWQGFVDTFRADTTFDDLDPLEEYAAEPVVVHAPQGVTPSYDPITSLQVQSLLATQRRRLRG